MLSIWLTEVTTKTPPLLKWLLVERAAIAGEIARLQNTQEQLSKEQAKQQARLNALDSTMRQVEKSINVSAAGQIQTHAGKYGKRGGLKAFIIGLLKQAAPSGIGSKAIVLSVIRHFGLEFATKAEMHAFSDRSVRKQLIRLRQQGYVEVARHGKAQRYVTWYWKSQLLTLDELSAQVAAHTEVNQD